MPITILYCEGGAKSPDIRVLSVILAGVCLVVPSGSKYGFGQRVLQARGIQSGSVIAGLCDRDFDDDEAIPQGLPREWRIDGGKTQLGWRWERKELENYLIDPTVVSRALGTRTPDLEDYRAALQAAAETGSDYTAARTALSLNRPRFSPLENSWGTERNLNGHRFPDQFGEDNCRQGMRAILQDYAQSQIPSLQNALREFDRLLPLCRRGGVRFQHFLTFFAGKDLLLGMQSELARFGFESPRQFREQIIKGIAESLEDAWTWLPEWTQLRQKITSGSPQ